MTQDPEKWFRGAAFMLSAAAARHMPPDRGAEAAVAGRSNVGKSSFINAVTGLRKLARTSKTPGRTQLINFFALDPDHRLVDLPGYGFAKVPEAVRRRWGAMIEAYLTKRRSLRGVVVLMDCRHPLTDLDRQLLDWCRAVGLPVQVVLTKADKLSRGQGARVRQLVARELEGLLPGGVVSVTLFSATTRQGIDEVYAALAGLLGGEAGSSEPGKKEAPVNVGRA